MPGGHSIVAAGIAAALALAGCGGGSAEGTPSRHALASYVQRVEPIRLAVNRLLDDADPILEGYRSHRLSPREAGRRFDRLERRFARYTEQIAAIKIDPVAGYNFFACRHASPWARVFEG